MVFLTLSQRVLPAMNSLQPGNVCEHNSSLLTNLNPVLLLLHYSCPDRKSYTIQKLVFFPRLFKVTSGQSNLMALKLLSYDLQDTQAQTGRHTTYSRMVMFQLCECIICHSLNASFSMKKLSLYFFACLLKLVFDDLFKILLLLLLCMYF